MGRIRSDRFASSAGRGCCSVAHGPRRSLMGGEEIRMRRAIAIIIVAVVGTLAFAQTGPVDESRPAFGTLPPEVGGATGDPSAWYCPWVASGACLLYTSPSPRDRTR